jgi:hypothetical protein
MNLPSGRKRQFAVTRKRLSPNPTLFRTREASEPYSRGKSDSALKATPHSSKGDVRTSGP